MGKYIAEQTVKKLIEADRPVKGAKVLILGWTFKEDVPDTRNTRVIDIYRELVAFGVQPLVYDPEANSSHVHEDDGLAWIGDASENGPYDAVIVAVTHRRFIAEFPLARIYRLGKDRPPVLIDIKGMFSRGEVGNLGFGYWQL